MFNGKRISKKWAGGFTLIELLVVISIIGFLSSIVLVSISSVRVKARNTERILIIEQYKYAFDLSFSEDGYYPGFGNPTTLNPGDIYCLGDYGSDTCTEGPAPSAGTEHIILSQAIERFLPRRVAMKPINVDSIFFGPFAWDGPVYICDLYLAPKCLQLRIGWIMEGTDADCRFGITTTPSSFGKKITGSAHTYCYLYLQQ